jgi:hypothetical protein
MLSWIQYSLFICMFGRPRQLHNYIMCYIKRDFISYIMLWECSLKLTTDATPCSKLSPIYLLVKINQLTILCSLPLMVSLLVLINSNEPSLLVSFAAINRLYCSQRVFIVVRVKCDPRFSADLKEQRICVKSCFLGKATSKTHKMLKTAFGDNAMGRTQTSEWFSRFICRETSVEDSERSVVPRQVAQTKTWRMFAKSSMKTDESLLRRLLAGRLGLSYGICLHILRT